MKAAQINHYGDASAIVINEIEKPTIKPGRVLIEVSASSLNPFDSKIRSGMLKDKVPLELPVTLGGDFAGVVVEVAGDVTSVNAGDRVYGQANAVGGSSGSFAEYAAAAAQSIAKSPANLSFIEAAALPMVGVSALQALTELISLKPEQKIFIHGGAGGIGSIAIQIAKHIGAYVATTATGKGTDLVKQLGADEIIDYKTQGFSEILHNYDAVFDTVGGSDVIKSLAILKSGGTLVSMTTPVDEATANEQNITALVLSTNVTTKRLEALNQLVESGVVTPRIGKVLPLEQIKQAFELREARGILGKIVLQVKAT